MRRCRTALGRTTLVALVLLAHGVAVAWEPEEVTAAKAKEWTAVDIGPLLSGVHHAVMKFEGQEAPYPQYKPTQIIHIAETMLAYQNGDGGWPANIDWTREFTQEELAALPNGQAGVKGKKSTLDNDNTWSQVGYLAQVYRQCRLERYSASALRGVDYILKEQRASGGWRGSDVDAITFNDNVMVGVLRTLRTIVENRDLYDFVDEARRANAKAAYDKGIRCTLACQIKVGERLTAWCEQHDHETLAPIWARTFEPPSIAPGASVNVVELLMEIPNPSPEVITAIEAAVAWFEKVKIPSLRIDRVPAEPVTFERHYSDFDCVEVKDPAAPPIWARYYDPQTETPLFCNRDRKMTLNFAELNRERRTGMPWYGGWPASLLEKDYPAWKARLIKPSDPPRLYVIGDSTAAAYPPERAPLTGWAQVLQEFFNESRIVVVDKARGGRSAKSFYEEGAWIPVAECLRDKDYVFIQFGHNDSKKDDPKRFTDPDTTYIEYLKKYIAETQAKGAQPVLVTSINRNAWNDDGTLKDTLGGYPPAMRRLSQELQIPLLDLHKATQDLYQNLGPERTKALFMNLEKGASPNYPEGSSDNTHLQEAGAREVCRLVATALTGMDLPLKEALKPERDAVAAFPGAEGYGKWSKGGRGGDVYAVTTLADAGPGSLRDAILSAKGPRTVVFEVSGTIELKSAITVEKKAGLTIAGQTAPGDGITLKDYGLEFKESSDIVVRYLRLRMGDQNKPTSGPDVMTVNYCDNFIVDHCSLSWGIDGNQDMRGCTNYTMQWCILSEALNNSIHNKGAHAMCASFRQPKSNITIHHNLFSTSRERHPSIGGNEEMPQVVVDFRNNVDYNWTGAANVADSQTNLIGNYFRPGPETDVTRGPIAMKTLVPKAAHGYMSGNIFEGRDDLTADNYAAVDFTRWLGQGKYRYDGTIDDWKVAQPFDVGDYAPATQSAAEAFEGVLAQAGMSLKRDAVDVRVIDNVRTKQGRVIDSQDEVGGWPVLLSVPAPADADRDGMPDAWESEHGLDPRNAQDRNGDADGDGYTNLEAYLNSLCTEASPTPVPGNDAWRDTGPEAAFEVAHDRVINPIQSGKWRLNGAAAIRFADRIEPHENSELVLIGPGLQGLEGRFTELRLPAGWKGELVCDDQAGTVTLKNLKPERAPAFPGVEGFGKYTVGGRGGKVYEVTNLNDAGPGSFREACEAKGPRTVVFRVSGTIALESELKVRNPNITIAGQTAPGDGICIKNYQFNFDTQEVIIRYMRFRPGDEKGKEQDAFGGKGDHIVVDHCSVSWGVDETLSINKGSNLSVQWCLVSESLTKSLHKKGSHGYGGLWGGPGGSWHHNVLAHHSSRNPRASGNEESGLIDVRNNVIYNWGFNSAYGGEMWPRNWVNNYYKYGPATLERIRDRIFEQKDPRGKMYCAGNYVWGFPEISQDNWAGGIDFAEDGEASEQTLRVHEPFIVAPVTTQTAEDAYELVLADVGCSLKRDPVDTRVLEEIRSGTAKYGETYGGGGKGLIDSQTAVGGWPELRSLPAPDDTDHDGMPDAWESGQGLNPNDPADGAQFAADGYTHLERYLNSLVPVK